MLCAQSYQGELINIISFQHVARCAGSKYIIDDCSCTQPNVDSTRAWVTAVARGIIVPITGHRTDEITKTSQHFKVKHERHTFCAGIVKPIADSCARTPDPGSHNA